MSAVKADRWIYRSVGPNRAERRAAGWRNSRTKRLIVERSQNTPYRKDDGS